MRFLLSGASERLGMLVDGGSEAVRKTADFLLAACLTRSQEQSLPLVAPHCAEGLRRSGVLRNGEQKSLRESMCHAVFSFRCRTRLRLFVPLSYCVRRVLI